MARAARLLTDEIWFGEGPRWHDGRLWFGDWAELAVRSILTDGTSAHRGSSGRLPAVGDGLGAER